MMQGKKYDIYLSDLGKCKDKMETHMDLKLQWNYIASSTSCMHASYSMLQVVKAVKPNVSI